jgi:hypothetical protein
MGVIQFRKISSGQTVANYISDVIDKKLESGLKVFWLVPGGSSIAVAIYVATLLQNKNLR